MLIIADGTIRHLAIVASPRESKVISSNDLMNSNLALISGWNKLVDVDTQPEAIRNLV